VLYVLDGQAAFTSFGVDRAITELAADGTIEPWIAVAIDATLARTDELAHHPARYARFVAGAVVPAVADHLRVRRGRESTAVLGYSYGGLGAVRMHLARPDVFGRVIAMSPSVWVRDRAVVGAFRRWRTELPVRLWIDVGAREGHMVRDARALRDAAIARGMHLGADLGYAEAADESHDMSAAGRRMRPALAFALR
jgi:enterochelin esterase family protein